MGMKTSFYAGDCLPGGGEGKSRARQTTLLGATLWALVMLTRQLHNVY